MMVVKLYHHHLDYLEAIIEKLKLLSINMTSDNTVEETPKDLGALVPLEGKVKKRGSRAEVKIDPVTNLMWNLLMALVSVKVLKELMKIRRGFLKKKEECSEDGLIHLLLACIWFKVYYVCNIVLFSIFYSHI